MRNRLLSTLSCAALAASLASGARAQDAPAPKPQDAAPAPPGITVNGGIEVYYTYNFNRPGNNLNNILYNTEDAQFRLGLADLRIGKAATPESRAGFLVRLIAGDVEQNTLLADNTNVTGPGFDNILEAYGTLLLPAGGRAIKVDVGQFVTHVGYETIDIGTNNFVSRAFLFMIPPPFYNGGVRAAVPVSGSTTVTGFLLNRYNGLNDPGNRDLAPGFQIAHTLGAGSSIILNGLTSRENLGPVLDPITGDAISPVNNKQQSILDLIYTGSLGANTSIAVEALYRWGETAADESYGLWGVAGYGGFTLGSGNVVGLRAEYLAMDQEFAGTADDQTLTSFTASYTLGSGLFPGARTIFEVRHDRADEPAFYDRSSNLTKKSQTTFTIGQTYNF